MNRKRSFITGIKSVSLSRKEKTFLKIYRPWGVILFSRNIKTILQTKKLTSEIRKIFKDEKYPILIDQEVGREDRLKKFLSSETLTGKYFGNLYSKNKRDFNNHYKTFISQTSNLLKLIGVNINTVPVLDLSTQQSSNIIGDRSFSNKPKIVSKIGNFCIKNFHNNNIITVMKHIPGHGLARVDSHKKTPNIYAKYTTLIKKDFSTFKNKDTFLAMTAHIIYKDIDHTETATHSKKVIKVIRDKIGYKNILMSDDISMRALKYSIKENTKKAFTAGCNLVLHCNGNFKEMVIVAENSPLLTKFLINKTSQIYKILS